MANESFFTKAITWIENTNVPAQVRDVEVLALFTNPWFLVPFIALVGYLLWRQAFKELIILALFVFLWWISGTEYMQTLIVDGELQIKKVLPVLIGGAAILAFIIYLFFGHS